MVRLRMEKTEVVIRFVTIPCRKEKKRVARQVRRKGGSGARTVGWRTHVHLPVLLEDALRARGLLFRRVAVVRGPEFSPGQLAADARGACDASCDPRLGGHLVGAR